MSTQLICETQPLCLCIGESNDDLDKHECSCTGNITGMRKDICEACGAPMVEVED